MSLRNFFSGLFSSEANTTSGVELNSASDSGSDSGGSTHDVFDSWGTSTGMQTWSEASSIDRASSVTDSSFGSFGSSDWS